LEGFHIQIIRQEMYRKIILKPMADNVPLLPEVRRSIRCEHSVTPAMDGLSLSGALNPKLSFPKAVDLPRRIWRSPREGRKTLPVAGEQMLSAVSPRSYHHAVRI